MKRLRGVRITKFEVPQVVENGTSTPILLDCDYEFSEVENMSLVIKWFLDDFLKPVYQWIPGQRPQVLGVLKGRLNLSYVASSDVFKRHRAIEILQPTTELSGTYRCQVESFTSEDTMEGTMTVYCEMSDSSLEFVSTSEEKNKIFFSISLTLKAPPRWMEMRGEKPASDRVNVSCIAERVFPKPKMELWKNDLTGRSEMLGTRTRSEEKEYSYDVIVWKLIDDWSLEEQTIFECLLHIPKVQLRLTKKMIYYPGPLFYPLSQPGLTGPSLEEETNEIPIKHRESPDDDDPSIAIPVVGQDGGVQVAEAEIQLVLMLVLLLSAM
ncbi:unnamed protein product [Darwinula stevensoni]|uniref:Ig-like domain-containing protein n=1 Tax=Darwinula stevensoni TaxID=69355 RepID=A0A7R8XCD6_9CRUS|nr:unnamed protein product [Darwinula stevensoni]CAG0893222.1 unnamed protein product [Darwinula stevensoni]